MKKFYDLFIFRKERYASFTIWGFLLLAVLLPIEGTIKLAFIFFALAITFTFMFWSSLGYPKSLLLSIFYISGWLIAVPFIAPPLIIGLISFYWKDAALDSNFIIAYPILSTLLWVFAAFYFELNRIKPAITLLSGIFVIILTLAFLTTLDTSLSSLIFDKETIEGLVNQGIPSSGILEFTIKIITMPYVIATTLALIILQFRASFQNFKLD